MLFLLSQKMTQLIARGRLISTATSYEDVIHALNTLQTNAEYLRIASSNHATGSLSLQGMKKYLLRSGLTLDDVDKLSVIHVAGTKGKGSACAFTEGILRNYGFRTGFYSSPHLIHVKERIRINGRPIKEHIFTKYFWRVYNSLNSQKENDSDMPTYFKFITVLMFHIFLNSEIDVVILEVGIGGEYDCTNVVRRPVCVGITSLGLEHTELLGNTLEAIAYQKSGIFKEHSIAFTGHQPEKAMKILRQRSAERNCKLQLVPDFKTYRWNGDPPILGIPGNVQEINASLAVQLAHTWILRTVEQNSHKQNIKIHNLMNNHGSSNANHTTLIGRSQSDMNTTANYDSDSFQYNDDIPTISFTKTALALSSCTWPGRTQILYGSTMDFYLDGAHTCESIEFCANWYINEVKMKTGKRFLIFNVTGNRDVEKLLKPLRHLGFDRVYFVPNISGDVVKLDQLELQTPNRQQQERCWNNRDVWGEGNAVVLNNVSEALTHIKEENLSKVNTESDNRPQVLVTGSLHLVGAALLILDPNLTMKTSY